MTEPLDSESAERQAWLQLGLNRGWVKSFCLTHGIGLFPDEFDQVDAEGDPCFTALRIVETDEHRVAQLD